MTPDTPEGSFPLLELFMDAAPTLLVAASVVLAGTLLALLLRFMVAGLVTRTGLEALAERAGVSRVLYAIGVRSGLARLLGTLTAVAVLLAMVAVLADVLGLTGLAEGLGVVVDHVPDLAVAAGLTLLAFVGADFVSRLVEKLARTRNDLVSPKIASSLAYWAVLIVGLAMAVRNLGVDTVLLETLLAIVVGAVVVSFAAVVAWSSRDVIEGVVKRQYAKRHLRVGDRVLIGELEGVIEELDTVSAVLRADDDRLIIIPGKRLVDDTVQIIERRK